MRLLALAGFAGLAAGQSDPTYDSQTATYDSQFSESSSSFQVMFAELQF
jgi:hypothetical protein